MIGAFITLVILILLVTAVVGIFYIYDYYKKNMEEVATKFKTVDTRIGQEKDQRKKHITNLVTNINAVNSNIGDDLDRNDTRFASFSNGLNSVIRFMSSATPSTSLQITQLPSAVAPSMNLLSNVNVIGGMNINDLYYTSASDKKQFTIAGRNGTDSITYPDVNGRINLSAPLYTDKAVTLDGATVNAAMTFNKGANMGASISAVGANQGYIQTKSLGLGLSAPPSGRGSANPSIPNASMHIMTTTGEGDAQVPFKISVDDNDVLKMRKSGIIVTRGIYLTPNPNINNDDAGATKIEITNNGELVITPPPSAYETNGKGNLYINGNIKASGTINTVGGNIAETSVSIRSPIHINENEGFTSGPIPTTKKTLTPVDYMNHRFLVNK